MEVRPKADFNKGHAVNYLLEYLVNKNNWDSSQVLAIYIGDDRTDEDAFKVIFFRISSKHQNLIFLKLHLNMFALCYDQVLSGQDGGFGILVSKKRRTTDAFYSLKDPPQVMSSIPCVCM